MQPLFFLLLALGCISMVSTNKCYSCDSNIKPECSDPFNTNAMTDADKQDVLAGGACVKTKTETKGGTQVARAAAPTTALCREGINSCEKQGVSGITVTICCCTSDLCNGVSTIRQQPLIVFITISTLAMLAYRWF